MAVCEGWAQRHLLYCKGNSPSYVLAKLLSVFTRRKGNTRTKNCFKKPSTQTAFFSFFSSFSASVMLALGWAITVRKSSMWRSWRMARRRVIVALLLSYTSASHLSVSSAGDLAGSVGSRKSRFQSRACIRSFLTIRLKPKSLSPNTPITARIVRM